VSLSDPSPVFLTLAVLAAARRAALFLFMLFLLLVLSPFPLLCLFCRFDLLIFPLLLLFFFRLAPLLFALPLLFVLRLILFTAGASTRSCRFRG
jgi:hypothetical protein